VWSRQKDDYDVLIYVANWPKKRVAAWDTLLKARAIENMSYCIGVNIIGTDGNNLPYVGHSGVYNVLGNPLHTHPPEDEAIETVVLDKNELETTREHLGFLKDKDAFNID
jgi:predicted amidohydrolase